MALLPMRLVVGISFSPFDKTSIFPVSCSISVSRSPAPASSVHSQKLPIDETISTTINSIITKLFAFILIILISNCCCYCVDASYFFGTNFSLVYFQGFTSAMAGNSLETIRLNCTGDDHKVFFLPAWFPENARANRCKIYSFITHIVICTTQHLVTGRWMNELNRNRKHLHFCANTQCATAYHIEW